MAEPISKTKYGTIEVAVFLNKGDKGEYHSASLQKSWKKDDKWDSRTISAISVSDIPVMIAALQEQYTYMLANKPKFKA